MKSKLINLNAGTVEVVVLQEGEHDLICFNGYGKLAKDFTILLPALKAYRVLVVHLPFHGQSSFSFKGIDITEFWLGLLQALNIKKFSILAYSIGAHFAYSLCETARHQIEMVCLLAPDGVLPSPVARFATFSPLGRYIMSGFVKRGGGVISVIKILSYIKIISPEEKAFFIRKIRTMEDRETLKMVWQETYYYTPDYTVVLEQEEVKVVCLLGKHDRVFPLKRMKKRLAEHGHIKVLVCEANHNMLTNHVSKELINFFSQMIN